MGRRRDDLPVERYGVQQTKPRVKDLTLDLSAPGPRSITVWNLADVCASYGLDRVGNPPHRTGGALGRKRLRATRMAALQRSRPIRQSVGSTPRQATR